ncbi:ABC transporter substrate-binding protein [Fusobacterium sp. PH5-44]|uniref:ABC transporter substrate-binding protein n=1 Tax=unclassified Fusobacterium TaxID=2648384 RepID=UPI003D213424
MKNFLKVFSTLLLTASLSLLATNEIQAAPKDTLIVAQGADAKSLDPHATNDQPSSRVNCQIYDRLVEQGNDLTIQGSLAESWEQPDNLTTIFKLRKGVKFHNGEELKSSDVKFTFERMKNSPTVKHIIDSIVSVETPDDYTVVIKTEKPFGALLSHLSHTAASILNEKAVNEKGDKYGQNPVGTGPYKFVSWRSGDSITLEAFSDYFKGAPEIKNAIIRNISENPVRAIALETGEVQIAYDLDPIDKVRIKEDEKFVLLQEPAYSMTYLGFNTKKAPFDNEKFRQAVAYAIDIKTIVDVVFEGAAEPANSLIGPKVFGYNPNAKFWKKDIEKSKALLKELNLDKGFKCKIWVNDNKIRQDIAVILQGQLKEVGIELAVETIEWGAFLDGTEKGNHEMFILGWSTVTGDADYGLFPLLHSANHGGAGNRAFYSNSAIDEMLEKARNTVDQNERKELYAQVQVLSQEEIPNYPIAFVTNNAGLDANLEGFHLSAAGHHRIYGVKYKK